MDELDVTDEREPDIPSYEGVQKPYDYSIGD